MVITRSITNIFLCWTWAFLYLQDFQNKSLLFLFSDRLTNGEIPGFFSLGVFKEHIKPRLMQLFGVRDSQIRMLLLKHFSKFVHVFSHDELSQHILPEVIIQLSWFIIVLSHNRTSTPVKRDNFLISFINWHRTYHT